jgi:hypothetical protein
MLAASCCRRRFYSMFVAVIYVVAALVYVVFVVFVDSAPNRFRCIFRTIPRRFLCTDSTFFKHCFAHSRPLLTDCLPDVPRPFTHPRILCFSTAFSRCFHCRHVDTHFSPFLCMVERWFRTKFVSCCSRRVLCADVISVVLPHTKPRPLCFWTTFSHRFIHVTSSAVYTVGDVMFSPWFCWCLNAILEPNFCTVPDPVESYVPMSFPCHSSRLNRLCCVFPLQFSTFLLRTLSDTHSRPFPIHCSNTF